MEQSPKMLTVGRQSFSCSSKKMRLQNIGRTKHVEGVITEMALAPSCSCSFDIPKSPFSAMNFLSRSWSPSSTDFFHMLSSSQILLSSNDEASEDENGKPMIKSQMNLNKKDVRIAVDHSWTWLRNGQQTQHIPRDWINAKKVKNWLDITFLSHLSRRGGKKKEESRLQSAQIQAALSVTQLAAAVVGFASNSSCNTEDSKDGFHRNYITNEVEVWNRNMGQAISSAAALMAAVCAEAAESAGASRAHVASAVSSGLAVENASDILTLTANAATCLRGTAVLKLREEQRSISVLYNKEMLAQETELPVCANSGKIQVMVVSILIKNQNPILRLKKKFWHGAITRYKEYRIITVNEDIIEAALKQDINGLSFLSIGTPSGAIRLLFSDVKLCRVWKISISNILHVK